MPLGNCLIFPPIPDVSLPLNFDSWSFKCICAYFFGWPSSFQSCRLWNLSSSILYLFFHSLALLGRFYGVQVVVALSRALFLRSPSFFLPYVLGIQAKEKLARFNGFITRCRMELDRDPTELTDVKKSYSPSLIPASCFSVVTELPQSVVSHFVCPLIVEL